MHLRRHQLRRSSIAFLVASVALAGVATAAAGGATERVSVSSGGIQGNDRSGLWRPSISADGNLVAFDSTATDLAPGATSGRDNVYLRNRAGGSTELISATSSGGEGNGASSEPALSGDGRYVAFHTTATDLVPGGPAAGIVVLDRLTHSITPVSVAGKKAADGHDPSISDDGRYVAFESDDPDLAPGPKPASNPPFIYVRDLVSQKTELVSVNSAGKPAGGFGSFSPVISGNGRYVAFYSDASNLVAGDTNQASDVFVHDLQTGSTVRVSVDSAGGQSVGGSFDPSISADGRYVAFDAVRALVPDDTNLAQDVYVHDLLTGRTTRVSVDSAGAQANAHSDDFSLGGGISGPYYAGVIGPQISGDGRYVAFESDATNLVTGDTNQASDVFVHDLQTGATTRASVDSSGGQSNGPASDPAVDADGSVVAFLSAATNLVVGDTNTCGGFPNPGECPDVFVHMP